MLFVFFYFFRRRHHRDIVFVVTMVVVVAEVSGGGLGVGLSLKAKYGRNIADGLPMRTGAEKNMCRGIWLVGSRNTVPR